MNSSDASEYFLIPFKVRGEISAWEKALRTVKPPVTAALRQVAEQFGVSYETARRKYYAFKSQGWRGLRNNAKAGIGAQKLPSVFIEHWKSLTEDRQRKSKAAWQQLVADWHSGKVIPGYEHIPSSQRRELPPGWSYENLMRNKPSKAELDAVRIGRASAHKHLPQTFSTRKGLWVGSHIAIDDLYHDNFVIYKGHSVRVLEFDALDVFSGYKLDWITKPRFERADGTFDGLKESQVRLLLAKIFAEKGYSPRGTEIMAEHGTAAVSERIEDILRTYTRGAVTVRRSGIIGKEQVILGEFHGRGGGNPRFKGPLESLRNLIHNRLDMLPGQTGLSTDRRPEALHGLLTYTESIMKVAERLPRQAALMLQFPLLDYSTQFVNLLLEVYDTINRRTDHELEGWAECGHQVIEYRLSPDVDAWMSNSQFLALPAPVQSAMRGVVTANPAQCSRTRFLSPQEVWKSGCAELVRLPDPVICELLGPDLATPRRVNAGYFEFEDENLGPGTFRYLSRCTDMAGRVFELRDQEKYEVVVNPFSPDTLYITDAAGRFLGTCQRDQRVCRGDLEALQRRAGEVRAREAELFANLRRRHSPMTEEHLAARESNLRIAESALQTRKTAKLDTQAAAVGAAILETEPTYSHPPEPPAETIHIDLS